MIIPPNQALEYMLNDRAYSILPLELREKCFPWLSREKGLRSPFPVEMDGVDYHHIWKECITIYEIFRRSKDDLLEDIPYVPLARTFVIHEQTKPPHPTNLANAVRHPCIAKNGNGFMYVLIGRYDFGTGQFSENHFHGIWVTKI